MFSASASSRNACAILLGVLLHGDAIARGIADDLVVHVGDVHDVLQLVAALLQEAPQRVDHDEGAEVADVAVVIHRGTAGVHADQVVFQWMKLLDLAGQGIEKLKRHEFFLYEYGILDCRDARERGSTEGDCLTRGFCRIWSNEGGGMEWLREIPRQHHFW